MFGLIDIDIDIALFQTHVHIIWYKDHITFKIYTVYYINEALHMQWRVDIMLKVCERIPVAGQFTAIQIKH